MAAPGTYVNPSQKWCWETCTACMRCKNKGRYAACATCSGRHDPRGMVDEHPDDICACTEGVLRYRTEHGNLIVRPYRSNPYNATITERVKTDDERDWDSYLQEYRERMDNPYISPISIDTRPGKKAYFQDLEAGFFDENGNPVQ